MTLEEFLRWEDGTDTRYELIRGVPIARPLQPVAHGMLLARLCSVFHFGLQTRPEYVALLTSAIASPSEAGSCYLADFTVIRGPIQPDRQLATDPIVIVEVLSESTAALDREIKLPDYFFIPSVQEILLVESSGAQVELWQRRGFDWRLHVVADTAETITLTSVGIEISMSKLYDGLVSPDETDL